MTDVPIIRPKQSSLLSFIIIFVLAVMLWLALKGPGTDADGLKSAYLLETGKALSSLSDHLLWQELSWATLKIGSWFDAGMRGIPAQQTVNLVLFSLALFALWKYLRSRGRSFWLVGLGLLACYTSLRCLVGEDVDVGPLLLMVLVLFYLPDAPKPGGLMGTILLLALAPVMHKSLVLLVAGWWLAEVIFGAGIPLKRILRSSLIVLAALAIALSFYYASWALFSDEPDFSHWFFPHGGNTQSFMSFNPLVVMKGLGLSGYRSFLAITPIKAFAQGDIWGTVGLALSAVAILSLLTLLFRSIWRGKKEAPLAKADQKIISTLLLMILPSLIFFLFWIPGYYTYWARFLPAFWILLALRLPNRIFVLWTELIAIGLLLLVNLPSQYIARDGEEAGILARWLAPRLSAGDLLIIPGNGVLYFGSLPEYHYHVEIATLDVLETMDNPITYLQSRAARTWQHGHKVWLVMDYARWTSERIIQGKQARFTRGLDVVENAFALGLREEFNNPAMEEAWITECLPR